MWGRWCRGGEEAAGTRPGLNRQNSARVLLAFAESDADPRAVAPPPSDGMRHDPACSPRPCVSNLELLRKSAQYLQSGEVSDRMSSTKQDGCTCSEISLQQLTSVIGCLATTERTAAFPLATGPCCKFELEVRPRICIQFALLGHRGRAREKIKKEREEGEFPPF